MAVFWNMHIRLSILNVRENNVSAYGCTICSIATRRHHATCTPLVREHHGALPHALYCAYIAPTSHMRTAASGSISGGMRSTGAG